MSTRPFTLALALLISTVLIAPSALFMAPDRAQAQAGEALGVPTAGIGMTDWTTALKSTFSAVQEALIQISTYTSAAADVANFINAQVLQPLAFVLSGNLMKMLTASVTGFVIGKANGTGIPQFVVDVQKSMRTVADSQALAYLKQVNLTNSPFSSSITAALRSDYLQGSSLKGFWDANLCSLSNASPNVPAYLAGNWSQGGVAAWFALTTESQNNPYTLYLNTSAQMRNVIGPGVAGVTGARTQTLAWGQGFMSWCGTSDAATQSQAGALTSMDACIAQGNTPTYCDKIFADAGGAVGGINPGDPCMKDGVAGTIQTPGSVINSTFAKILGGQQDQIVRMGNIGPQITSILGNIANVVNTVKFASSLLGGGSSGGLLNAGQPGGQLAQFSPQQDTNGNFTSGYLGATDASIYSAAVNSAVTAASNVSTTSAVAAAEAPVVIGEGSAAGSVGSDMLSRAQSYQTAWESISGVANAASSAVQDLVTACTNYGNSSQVVAAQTTLADVIDPTLAKAAAAPAIAAAALAQDALVKSETSSSPSYSADLQKLQTMSPTYAESSQARSDSVSYRGASASPYGSLTVSGGSLTDRLNLIRTNAETLRATTCESGFGP